MATTLTPAKPNATAADAPPTLNRPPWPAAVAALLAFAALALACHADIPLACLGAGLLASYLIPLRFENTTLTKWTLRIIVLGAVIFSYLVNAVKDDNGMIDVRYGYSFALAAASELTLQFWRREPTAGPRAPFTVFLSAVVFLAGCSAFDEQSHYLWFLAPAYFLFFALALPGFRPRSRVPLRLILVPCLAALALGGLSHAGFYLHRNDLNALGGRAFSGRASSVSMGMSGQPLLGSSFTLRDSLTRVLRVQNLGDDPYLRGMTFDTYSSRAWGPSLDQRTFQSYRPPAPDSGGVGTGLTARFVRLDDAAGLLFAPLHSATIITEGTHTLEWAGKAGGPLRTAAQDTDPLTYDVALGKGDATRGLGDTPPTDNERERDLAVPQDIDPRVVTKAQGIGGKLKNPQEKIDAVIRFLYANNQYSLTTDPGAGEPISNFILQRKAAHCEYFASSAVVLLRCLGVPTRYVSGYFAHEADGPGQTLVRQRDAHAWAESWVQGVGWVTVDATPGGGRPDHLAGAIPLWWRVWEWIQDVLGAIRRWVISSSWVEKVAVFLVLVLGLLIPQLYRWWQRRRGANSGFRYSSPDAALATLAARFETLLSKRGMPCPEGEPWRDHLRAVARDKEILLAPWDGFARDYGRARFGPWPGPDEIAHLDRELRELEKEPI